MADYSAHKTAVSDVDYITKLNAHMDDTQDIATEVENARVGLSTLKAQIDLAIATTSEVQTARDGLSTLVAQIDDLQARLADLETGVSGGSYTYDPDRVIDANGFRQNALDSAIASGAFVACCLYDTSRDSDGGAWRKRCAAAGWYTETLSTATRGATRPFPALALLLLTTDTLTIYDAADPALPMWMVFQSAGASASTYNAMKSASGACTAVTALEGRVLVASSGGGTDFTGLMSADFVADEAKMYRTSAAGGLFRYPGSLSQRNAGLGTELYSASITIDEDVNHVAAVLLSSAPTDPHTGLLVPTVALATAGGMSVLQDDGTIILSSSTTAHLVAAFDDDGGLWTYATSSGNYYHLLRNVGAASTGFSWHIVRANTYSDIESVFGSGLGNGLVHVDGVMIAATASGIALLKDHATAGLKSITHVNTDYNTGWMRGDIQACVLSDTTIETLTDADTITDRSVKALSITIPSSQTVAKTAVASGAALVWYNATADLTLTLGAAIPTGELCWWEEVSGVPTQYCYDFNAAQGYVNGVAGTVSTNVTAVTTTLTLKASAKLALVRATTTTSDAAEILARYRSERALFQAGSDCTLAGTSNNVLGLALDPVSNRLHAVTTYGRSEFQGLVRTAAEATPVGTPAGVSAVDERILQAGGTSADLYAPQERLTAG